MWPAHSGSHPIHESRGVTSAAENKYRDARTEEQSVVLSSSLSQQPSAARSKANAQVTVLFADLDG
jgi:hypothetical protein